MHKPPPHAVGRSRIKYPCRPLTLRTPISFDHQHAIKSNSLTVYLVTKDAGRCSSERIQRLVSYVSFHREPPLAESLPHMPYFQEFRQPTREVEM
jgi:hypothetical protein